MKYGTFRKNPVFVEAYHFAKGDVPKAFGGQEDTPIWIEEAYILGLIFKAAGETFIKTREGQLHVSDGDWIIKGVRSELYPCKPDIFAETYEIVGQQ